MIQRGLFLLIFSISSHASQAQATLTKNLILPEKSENQGIVVRFAVALEGLTGETLIDALDRTKIPSGGTKHKITIEPLGSYPAIHNAPVFSQSDIPVLQRANTYNYAPSVLFDGKQYRMWWCGAATANSSESGDHILYAEAGSLSGPWHSRTSQVPGSFDVHLKPTFNPGDFDGRHTCDPSVMKAPDGNFYLYYGGVGHIGVASSTDGGYTWTRANRGKPIVFPNASLPSASLANTTQNAENYGRGQPSILFIAPHYYLTYTDANSPANNLQHVIRAKDPLFTSELEDSGTTIQGHSVDWQYSKNMDLIIVAANQGHGVIDYHFLNPKTFQDVLSRPVRVLTHAQEGPGLLSRPDRTAIENHDCGGHLTLAAFSARGASASPEDWTGLQVSIAEFLAHPDCGASPIADYPFTEGASN